MISANAAYRYTNEAFMPAYGTAGRRCQDPLGAIGACLLSIG